MKTSITLLLCVGTATLISFTAKGQDLKQEVKPLDSKNAATANKANSTTATTSTMPSSSVQQAPFKQAAKETTETMKPELKPTDTKTTMAIAVTDKAKEEIKPARAIMPIKPAFSSLSPVAPETNTEYKPILHIENSSAPAPAVKEIKKTPAVPQQQKVN